MGEIANSELRRLLAYNKSFNCTDIAVGDTALIFRRKVGRALLGGDDLRKSWISMKRG